MRPPYVQNWNLALQRELAGNFLVEVRYVGTRELICRGWLRESAIFNPAQSNIDRPLASIRVVRGDTGPWRLQICRLDLESGHASYHAMRGR